MPRIPAAQVRPSEIYGKVKVDNNLTFGERIRKRFRPTDTVKVHNITNHQIQWQWLEELDEEYVIEDGTNIKIVDRGDPQLWMLGAGEQDILQGSCAYLMIEALYKQTKALKAGLVLHPLDEREIRNFSFDDPEAQEEFIDMVFLGKVTPQDMQAAALQSLGGDFQPKILETLPGPTTEMEEHERRITQDTSRRTGTQTMPKAAPAPPTEIGSLEDEFLQSTGVTDDEGEQTEESTGNDETTETTETTEEEKPAPKTRARVAA